VRGTEHGRLDAESIWTGRLLAANTTDGRSALAAGRAAYKLYSILKQTLMI